jgi:hypothetical protein
LPDFISDWLWENWKTMFNGPTITLLVIVHRRVGSEIVGGARVIMFALAMWVYGAYFHSQLVANYVWLYLCCVIFQTISRWVEARRGDHTISISSGLWALDYLKNCPDWLRSSWVVDVVIEPLLIFIASRFIANWDGPFAFLIGWGALGMVPMQWGRYLKMARMRRDAMDAILLAKHQEELRAAEYEKYQRYLAGQQQAMAQQTTYQGGPYYQNTPAQQYPVEPGLPKSNPIVDMFHSVKDTMVAAKETAAENLRTAQVVAREADVYGDVPAHAEQTEFNCELPMIVAESDPADMSVAHRSEVLTEG